MHLDLSNGNRMIVTLTGINLEANFNWHYTAAILSDSGSGTASTDHASGTIVVNLGVSPSGGPTATFGDCRFDMSDVSLSLSGGASWLYNAMISLFRDQAVGSVADGVCQTVHGSIQEQLNSQLASIPLQKDIDDNLSIDYSLNVNNGLFISPDQLLVAGVAGEFYPKGGKPGYAPGNPGQMPNSICSRQYQIFVSSWTVETLGFAAIQAGLCQITITKEDVPTLTQPLFKTDFYAFSAPGIIKKFGLGTEVEWYIAMNHTPTVNFNEVDPISAEAGIYMTIRAKNGDQFEDAFTILIDITAVANASMLTNDAITAKIRNATATTSVVSSEVGPVDVTLFGELVKVASILITDAANILLGEGIPLPTMKGLTFKDPELRYGDGYMAVATEIDYDPNA